FDLFIVDLDLDERGGFELLRTIDEKFPYVPVILNTATDVTSTKLTQEIPQIRRKGIWHLLEKPFSFDLLNCMVAKYLDRQQDRLFHTLHHSRPHGEDQRQHQRRAHIVPTHLSFEVIRDGELVRETIKGILTDISDCGVGLLTNHPLEQSQLICFDEALDRKCGVVTWAMTVSDQTCRAGIRFC
ncbi:MAG: hypothetical protein P8X63_13735, partial [Desulfuromonadaceae bacterium]